MEHTLGPVDSTQSDSPTNDMLGFILIWDSLSKNNGFKVNMPRFIESGESLSHDPRNKYQFVNIDRIV